MYKKTLSLLFLLFLLNHASAQHQDSGTNLTKCDFEPDAPAVVIFDKGKTEFLQNDEGFFINHTRNKRVKIFKESAFDQAEVSIDLYIGKDDLEKVYDITATTYNINGNEIETTHLDPSQIFKEPINDYWYRKKFALPNVKEGCIIEYSYTIKTPFFMHLPDWEFQSDIPTIYSEYTVKMIPFYSYMYRAQGFSKFDISESKEEKGVDRSFMGLTFKNLVYKFALKNVNSFKDVSFISSKEDYIKKIDFQLSEINYPSGYSKKIMTTWPKLSKDFLDSQMFGKYINKAEKIGKKEFSYLLQKTDKEKVDEVLNYMKTNYKPNGYINKWASKPIKVFMKEKTGNTANINLMALGILRSAGVQVDPVIISTRSHGRITAKFPFSDLFNNVVILATIDGSLKLLDATDAYCANNIIPANCYNGKGYIVKKDNENWVKIRNTIPSVTNTTIRCSLNSETNTISGFCTIRNSGHASTNERKRYNRNQEKFAQKIEEKGLTLQSDVEVAEMDDKSKLFQYNFSFESFADNIEGRIVFAPFLKFPDQTNPFKQEKRELAIDLTYPRSKNYTATIAIPEGYKVERLPEAYARETQNTKINFNAHQNKKDNTIFITATVQLKKPVYLASTYPELKSLLNKVIEKFNQKIVVIRNDEIALQ